MLDRNFLHSSELEFAHPTTGKVIQLTSPLPPELDEFLAMLRDPVTDLGLTPSEDAKD
jgi:23S rRNA pseudouridine1911/1915/1917 synthase